MTAPAGFVPYNRSSRYLQLIGPVYEALGEAGVADVRIDERHTNSRGYLHGGLMVAVVDVVLGHACERSLGDGRRLVTISLTTDFVGKARAGIGSSSERLCAESGGRCASVHARPLPMAASCCPAAACSASSQTPDDGR